MKKTLLFLLLIVSLSVSGQRHKFKFETKDYIATGLLFVGGAADGLNQTVRHHYYKMQEKHPNINDAFWGADQWKNKWQLDENGDLIPYGRPGWAVPDYKEKFWGSSTVFVSVTDAHHLTREIDKLSTIGGTVLITIGEKKPIWDYMLRFAISLTARQAGFYFVHDIYYK